MKLRPFLSALLLSLLALASAARAQEASAPDPASAPATREPALVELQALVEKVTTKLKAGQGSASALAPEIAQFDELLAKYPAKNEAGARIAMMKALLYVQVLNDEAKARELFAAIKRDYAETEAGKAVDTILARLDEQKAKDAAKAALVGKPAPELHFKWSSRDGLKTLSALKGQVVVLDFWATWCGPCIASFPQIREHVAQFKESPVTFLGVTSIQGFVANLGDRIDTKDDPAKEMALMSDFMKAKEMTWDVAFSEEEVFNPDYGIEGIPYVAIIAPDGTIRHAGLHPGNPASDIAGKIDAILKEFNLPVPAAKG